MDVSEFSHNQLVGMAFDKDFRGYVWGESAPPDPTKGPVMLVCVKEPGQTGRKRGACTLIPAGELVRVKA